MLGDFQCYLMQKTNKRTKNTFADLRILRSGHYPRLFRWSLNVKGLYKKERFDRERRGKDNVVPYFKNTSSCMLLICVFF